MSHAATPISTHNASRNCLAASCMFFPARCQLPQLVWRRSPAPRLMFASRQPGCDSSSHSAAVVAPSQVGSAHSRTWHRCSAHARTRSHSLPQPCCAHLHFVADADRAAGALVHEVLPKVEVALACAKLAERAERRERLRCLSIDAEAAAHLRRRLVGRRDLAARAALD
eukprot:4033959-Prymnesium_polylepis.2